MAARRPRIAPGAGRQADFAARVLSVVARIPVGRVATYGHVAALAGRPRAARAVGNILRVAHRPGLPYHRVVAAGGRLGGYSSLPLKRALLSAEGLTVTATRIVGFSDLQWGRSEPKARRGRQL